MGRKSITFSYLLAFLLVVPSMKLSAQELMFEKRPASINRNPTFGPNRLNFVHPFVAGSAIFPLPGSVGIKTELPGNYQVAAGIRYKRKISRAFAWIAEGGIDRSSYRPKQDSLLFPADSLKPVKHTLTSSGIFGGTFLRLRLGQKGDYLGNYLDFGLTGNLGILNNLTTKESVSLSSNEKLVSEKIYRTRFGEFVPFSWAACMRIGFDKFSLTASYRLSRLMNNTFEKDLPGLMIGLEFSPVRY